MIEHGPSSYRLVRGLTLALVALGVVCSRAGELHWTTNGMHMGVLSVVAKDGVAGLDSTSIPGGHDYIGKLTLSYALWRLVGEPVHEFIFSWDWHGTNLVLGQRAGRTWTTTNLLKYPDLRSAFFALKPRSLTLDTTIDFYDAAGKKFAEGHKTVNPAPFEQAGVKENLHFPGSPRWADFFVSDETDHLGRDELDQRHKLLFEKAARVQLGSPRIVQVTWPENVLASLLDELLKREGVPIQPPVVAESVQPKSGLAALAATPGTNRPGSGILGAVPAHEAAPGPNPFEQARQVGQAYSENPLERAARLRSLNPTQQPNWAGRTNGLPHN